MDYRNFKDSTASVKVLGDKAFNIAKNLKYEGYQRGLASKVYKFFDKELVEQLQKLIIRKFEKGYWQYFGCWSCWYAINKHN